MSRVTYRTVAAALCVGLGACGAYLDTHGSSGGGFYLGCFFAFMAALG